MAVSVLQGEFLFSKTFAAWLAGQVSFLQFYNPEHFRGFGIGVANGALWTPLGRKWLVTALFLSSFASYCVMDHQVNGPAGFTGAPIAYKLLHVTLIPHLWMFLLGILIHWNFDRLRPWLEGKFLPYLLGYAVFMALLVTLIDHRSLPFYLAYLPSRILLFSPPSPPLTAPAPSRRNFSAGWIFHTESISITLSSSM